MSLHWTKNHGCWHDLDKQYCFSVCWGCSWGHNSNFARLPLCISIIIKQTCSLSKHAFHITVGCSTFISMRFFKKGCHTCTKAGIQGPKQTNNETQTTEPLNPVKVPQGWTSKHTIRVVFFFLLIYCISTGFSSCYTYWRDPGKASSQKSASLQGVKSESAAREHVVSAGCWTKWNLWCEQSRSRETNYSLFLGNKIKSEGKWLSVVLNLCGMHEQGQHTVSFGIIWNGFIRFIQYSSAGVYDAFLWVFGRSSFKYLCYKGKNTNKECFIASRSWAKAIFVCQKRWNWQNIIKAHKVWARMLTWTQTHTPPCTSTFVRTFTGILWYAAYTHICDLFLLHSEERTISCTVLVQRKSKFISISQMMTLKVSPQSFNACRNISPGPVCGSLFLPKVISFIVRTANLCKTYGNPSRCVINVNIWDSWWRDCKSGGI